MMISLLKMVIFSTLQSVKNHQDISPGLTGRPIFFWGYSLT